MPVRLSLGTRCLAALLGVTVLCAGVLAATLCASWLSAVLWSEYPDKPRLLALSTALLWTAVALIALAKRIFLYSGLARTRRASVDK